MKLCPTALILLSVLLGLHPVHADTATQENARQEIPITADQLKEIITKGTTDQISHILKHGLHPDTRVHDGMPLLVMAAYSGRLEMVYTMLQHGANPNAAQSPGITALSVAAATNNVHMLDLLVSNGADINFRAEQGDSILMLACSQNAIDTVQVLLALKANPNIPDFNGVTPLIYTIARCETPSVICRMLLEHGADPNIAMKDGTTALMAAVLRDDVECARLLLNFGANVSAKDASGKTALEFADNPEVRKLLTEAAQ